MRVIPESEFIINEDGSIYHLHLKPEHISDTIITVGDPGRVAEISKHFDSIEYRMQYREFVTHTGMLRGKRLTAISTGMGTDNIDIAMTELDALANIDFQTPSILRNTFSNRFNASSITSSVSAILVYIRLPATVTSPSAI